MFTTPATNTRNQAIGGSRMQNGKLGSGSGWGGFGLPMSNAAPGGSGIASRGNTLGNFAQAIGGGAASQGSLDLSEFPSLSGGGQQQQNAAQLGDWGNPGVRQSQTPGQNPVQRPHGSSQRDPSLSSHQAFGHDSDFSFGHSMDAQFGSQRRSENSHSQAGMSDEFPPLGGMNGGGRHDRQIGHGGPGGLGAATFSGTYNPVNGQSHRIASGGMGDGAFGSAALEGLRSPSEIHRTPSSLQDNHRDDPRQSSQMPIHNQQHPNSQNPGQQGSSFGSQMADFSSGSPSQPQQPKQLSEMTESEKWGLEGLRAQLPNRPDADPFIMGHDLDSLGIDFNRNEPLFPTFAGPFADANARPAIPDFTVPPAYRVNNVPDLASRMPNFTDETLLMIFYQYPRDMLQGQAAAELFSRDWRWHKELQQWMMKDTSVAAPIRISERVERGVYIFFDAPNFRKERREFLLNYDQLEQRSQTQVG